MKQRNTVVTLALLGVLALAAVAGGLLPAGNTVHAADPVFDLVSDTACGGNRCVEENTPSGVNIGAPISATDADETDLEFGNTLTYKLGGTDVASFDIDSSTGQLITKAPLDFENPHGGSGNDSNTYSVTVTVDDGETRTDAVTPQTVTIEVTDVNEPPAAPSPPTVVSAATDSTTSLKVVWHAPENTGDAISSYSVEHKKTTDLEFTDSEHSGAATTATITNLEADTSYQVRVQATSPEGTSPWSLVGTGSTNKEGNSRPTFGATGNITRSVFENTAAGQDVGAPVTANDDDATTLTYRLEGPDAALFAFVTSSGQIRTKAPLNHESTSCGYVAPAVQGAATTCTHRVTVAVSDSAGGSDATAVNIMVSDRQEPVVAPARPTVRATENWSTRLDVSWSAPANTGPPITGYEVRYREGTSGEFLNDNCGAGGDDNCVNITGTKTTIVGPTDGLSPGASYQVQVLTIIAGGRKSVWSDVGTGRTNPANKEPRFDDRPSSGIGSARQDGYTTSRTVDENTASGRPVGRAVRAEDGDGHSRTYKLVESEDTAGARVEASKFDIDESSGQIRTKAPLNHEDTDCGYIDSADPTACTYTVKVEVRDGYNTHKVKEEEGIETDADDTITVTIDVRDKVEVPAVPTVTLTAPVGNETLGVIWDVPDNTGPAITGYDVQYRKGSGAFSADNCDPAGAGGDCNAIDGTTTIISGLDANTSYSVQVRARNAEGPSAWSRLVTIKTNKDTNAPPEFSQDSSTFLVAENTSRGQPVGSVTASDIDSTTWTYSLEGVDAASFSFNTRNGDISTRSSLNFEEKQSYSVRVKASDGNDGGSASRTVTINVTNVNEPPAPPAAPRVTATEDSGWSLDVTWNEPPSNTGKPPITDYDIRYRKKGEDENAWQSWAHEKDGEGNTDRKAKITTIAVDGNAVHLEPRTEYEVEVRATNAEGMSDWSNIGTGRTGVGNRRPSFDRTGSVVTLNVDENTRSGQNIGSAVSATDADSNRLTYSLGGPNKDLFTIVSSSGQIKTRTALDYETRQSYSLTVNVDDGTRRANSAAAKSVTISVNDVDEIPPPPAAPTVAGVPGSTDSVRVTWDASVNTGPAITDYEVRYGEAGSGGWTTLVGRTGADRSQIITGLTAGTRYQVQVRAKSDEGTGEWSRSGTGSPNPDVANRPPAFSGGTRSFSVPENTASGTDIGTLVTATDRDGDNLTYILEGTDAPSFNILSTGGGAQLQTSAALNHEETSSYSVTVRVRDGRGGTDAVNVTIRVTDVDNEAPDTPIAPTVAAASSTSLQATWDEPDNAGPPITDYDYRYREPSEPWTEVTNTTIRTTTVTIEGLTASTLYEVEVRAANAEGTSAWSNSGFGTTNAPGANNPPVFPDGASTERSVSAAAQAGTSIGLPVTATDADSGDTVTYSLEGRDVASFGINTSTGQLMTIAGVTLVAETTYEVEVVADDTKDTTRITVTIEATAAPPNNPPVFVDGTSTTRSVREDAATGTNIGSPVRATDADTGDTLTYTLGGTDAASFTIVAASGQIRTGVALDYETKASYTVTVTANDGTVDSVPITVTINVTQVVAAVFDCARGAVADLSNTGLVSDCEALLAARNRLEGNARLNWSDVAPIANWDGVYLRGTPSRVTMLILRSWGLDGTVPAELGQLDRLTQLNLHSNDLSGGIPDEIGNLRNLEQLLLHNNSLSGDFPDLSRLSNLEKLWLSGRNNRIGEGDGIPTWLNGLTNLVELNLWGNELGGTIPTLSSLTSLKLLKLQYNSLTGTIPTWFGSMNSLGGLYLHRNDLTGSIPSELGQLTRLRRLWLDRNDLTGSIPPELGSMSNLGTLNLHTNRLSGTIPTQLANLSRLQHFALHNNALTGTIPTGLGNLSELTRIAVSNNRLTGTIPAGLGRLDKLTLLWLSQNQLTGTIPSALGDLGDTLTNIKLAENNFDSGACVPRALANVATNDYSEAGLSICP